MSGLFGTLPAAGPFLDSLGRLFATAWPVAADYRIEDGLVVSLDERGTVRPSMLAHEGKSSYMPITRMELPAEFARVSGRDEKAGADEKTVLAFVRRYGLLGYSEALTPFEKRALELAGAPWKYDPIIDMSYNPNPRGDPLAWILAHADTVAFIAALAKALDRPAELRPLLERRIVRVNGRDELRFIYAVRGQTRPKQGRLPAPDPRVPAMRDAALGIIALCLNLNLGGVVRTVGAHEGRLLSLFQPRNLLDCIYWLLADHATGGRLRTCRECGHFFCVDDDRRQYCPPPMGIDGVSRCMQRAKVRKWRANLKRTEPSRPARRRR